MEKKELTLDPNSADVVIREIARLKGLKYSYRADINSRSALEMNFRTKFEDLNRVK